MYPQEHNGSVLITIMQFLHGGNGLYTWTAPNTPEVQDNNLATEIREFSILAVRPFQDRPFGSGSPDRKWRFSR
jgi:hypothetical protein